MRISDWSSDVCSSDLLAVKPRPKSNAYCPASSNPLTRPPDPFAGCSFSTASNRWTARSEEHTSELQSLMRISYAVFCLKKKNHNISNNIIDNRSEYLSYN